MPEQPRNDRDGKKPAKPAAPPPPNKFGRGLFFWVLVVALVVMVIIMMQAPGQNQTEVAYSTFTSALNNGEVKSVIVSGEELSGEFTRKQVVADGAEVSSFRTRVPLGLTSDFEFVKFLTAAQDVKEIKFRSGNNLLITIIAPIIPWILFFAVIWFLVFRQLKNTAGAGGMLGNFGRSKHRITSKEHTNITFDDVAGVQEAKDEVKEIVEFLRNPKRFQRLGGRIPRGVLLVGDPGTGKTLLAKAIAGEADVPFFSISGSDFVEMFVGVGASRVRDLFKQAKDNSPCIIFLDEIDAVGRRRGSGFSSGGHDEREQTLNAILVEMDGFETNDQVIVVAATNRLDVLDPALTRPGRFDRSVMVTLPDVKGRMEILKVHARKVKLGPDADLSRLAKMTPGFSGADLAACINESALLATMENKEFIGQVDLEEARDKVRFGRARKSRVIDEKEKLATAYHEAGHAVIQHLLSDADPIHKVTIIPRGNYGGATMSLPEKDRFNYTKRWCIAFMQVCFGGRIAEEMFTGDVNTGASGDIRQATSVARKMVTEWGMNDRLGFVFYGEEENRQTFSEGKEYSDETAHAIDEEIKQLIDGLFQQARKLLEANRDKVEALAKSLMKYETLDGQDIERAMRGEALDKPSVGDLIEQEKRRPTVIAPSTEDGGTDVHLGGGPLPSPG